jgi:hypothetical protein
LLNVFEAIGSYSNTRINVISPLYDITTNILNDLVNAINGDTQKTGFSASVVVGYKNQRSTYLVPTFGYTNLSSNSINITLDLRDVPGIYLLNMETNGSYSATTAPSIITVKRFIEDINTLDLSQLVQNIKGNLDSGLLSVDVLPIVNPNALYGILSDAGTLNAPVITPVYFGFLGDINFYQISDFFMGDEYNYLRKRLGLDIDIYSRPGDIDYSNGSSYPNGLSQKEFLGYLRDARYSQIKKSITDEVLINNKYLWLYLKFHKEIGCDQLVKVLTKKLSQDQEDLSILGPAQ